jgi:twitching motility protein PilT
MMGSERVTVDSLLRVACDEQASDLHLKVGNYPYIRVDGGLRPLEQYPHITPEDMLDYALAARRPASKRTLKSICRMASLVWRASV